MPVKIDPNTGERVQDVQINPNTGERIVASPPPQSMASKMLGTATDFGKGILKGGLSDVAQLAGLERKAVNFVSPKAAEALFPASGVQAAGLYSQPNNTAQAVGKGAEQAAEFLIPGGAEEATGVKIAPYVGRVASKLIPAAIGSAAVNTVQGGSPVTGALAGAGGAMLGSGLQKVAPRIAEAALGVRASDRGAAAQAMKYAGNVDSPGVMQPGETILANTQGVRPSVIMQQGKAFIADRTAQMESLVNNARQPISLTPARDIADSAVGEAAARNAKATLKETGDISDQLYHQLPGGGKNVFFAGDSAPVRVSTGKSVSSIPALVPASRALALKRGVGDIVNSWNPATASEFSQATGKRVYGAIDSELDRVAPGSGALNDDVSGMIPVVARAGATDLNAGITQRMIARGSAHTGALAGPLALGAAGATHSGLLGGIVGTGAGLLGQEVLTNPTVLMSGARVANSPLTRKLFLPPITGAALQLDRSSQ